MTPLAKKKDTPKAVPKAKPDQAEGKIAKEEKVIKTAEAATEDQPFDSTKIIYYCKDCKKATNPVRVGKKFRFKCSECKGKDVPFGTEKSVMTFYKIERGEVSEEPDEKAKKKYTSFDEYHATM